MSPCAFGHLIDVRAPPTISRMKPTLLLLAAGLIATQQTAAQDAFAFFRGETFPPARSEPAAWLLELHKADDLLGSNIAVAEFLPNTRLKWHNHPGGQILLITDGVGYYQEKGKQKQIIRVGDVIRCSPAIEHWHGSSIESGVTYVAISPAQKGGTVWGQDVTEEDYRSVALDERSTLRNPIKADSTFPFDVVRIELKSGKSLGWRKEPGGQVRIVLDGVGYYEERDKPKQIVRKGDVIKTAPGVEHADGASWENGTTYLSITPVRKP